MVLPHAGHGASEKFAVDRIENESQHDRPRCLVAITGSGNSFQADFVVWGNGFFGTPGADESRPCASADRPVRETGKGPPPSGVDGRNPKCCTAIIAVACVSGVFPMNDVVDRILNAYQLKRPLDAEQVADSRQRIERYIESLASAGQRDAPDRPALSFQDSIRSGRKSLGRFHGTQCAAGHRRIGSSDRLVTSIAIFAAAAHDPRRDRILRALHPETGVQRSVVEPRLVMMFSWAT
jgi:hypothetical protein